MIRHAEEKDIMGIMELLNQVLLVHHRLRKDIFLENGTKYSYIELKKIIYSKETPVFVYVDQNDKVIGHVFCKVVNKIGRPNMVDHKTLYIDDLCVDKNSRGRHVGLSLYNYAKDYAIANGFYNITLDVWEGNDKAKSFYDHIGMKPQKTVMEEILKKK